MNPKAPAANPKLFNMNTATFLITLASGNYAGSLFATYEAYVIADSGTVEARTCTINAIENLL